MIPTTLQSGPIERMRKLTLCMLILLATAGWVAPQQASAPEPGRVLIVLSSDSSQFKSAALAAKNMLETSDISSTTTSISKLTAAEIRGISGTVIAIGGRASQALAKDLPATTRLYYCMVPSPERLGLTDRSNTAGISSDSDHSQQIELIRSGSGSIRRIGAFYRSGSASSSRRIKAMSDSIPADMELVTIDLDAHNSVSSGIDALLDREIDLVWTTPDPAVYNSAMVKALLMECLQRRVPVFGFSHSLVRAGSVFGVGIEPKTQGSRIARMIITGAINEHHSPELTLAINEIVAERINFKLDASLRKQAGVVFESD